MRWLVAVSLLITSPALAEPPLGSRIDPAPKAPQKQYKETQEDAVRLMNMVARCVANAQPRKAEEILSLPLFSPEQNAAVRKLVGGEEDCMGRVQGKLQFQPGSLVSGMAEEIVLNKFRKEDIASLIMRGAALEPRNATEDLALCVIRRNPAAARRLIETAPASSQESAAVAEISPDLGPCVPEGMTLGFGKPAMRGIFAVAIYLSAQQVVSQ